MTSLAWLPASSPLANDRLAVGDYLYASRGSVWLFEVVSGQFLAGKRIASSENWGVAQLYYVFYHATQPFCCDR